MGRQFLKKSISYSLSLLANKPLICVGDYHTTFLPLDYPDCVLTSFEEELLSLSFQDAASDEDDSESNVNRDNLYQLARAYYYTMIHGTNTFWPNRDFHFAICGAEGMKSLVHIAIENKGSFSESEFNQVLALSSPQYEKFFPANDRAEGS